jgi:hypothetical protein
MGRPACHAVIDGQVRLDIRQLHRRGLLRPGNLFNWTWRSYGAPDRVSISVRDRALLIQYLIDGQSEVRTEVEIRGRPCRYGGQRFYFHCPHCSRTCEIVVMTTSGRAWGCRKCLKLRYESQRLSQRHRLDRRAAHLQHRAGTENDHGWIIKHKWMRWPTFNSLMDRANELEAESTLQIMQRVFRLTGIAPPKKSTE